MSEEAKTKPRKPHTPSIDAVIAAIARGEYDETIGDLLAACRTRNELQREAVLVRVREVFGEDAHVITTSKNIIHAPDRPNPFIKGSKAAVEEMVESEPKSATVAGFRFNPKDEKAYRQISSDAGFVLVSDAAGEIQTRVPQFEWDAWKVIEDPGAGLDSKLDQVEQQMSSEASSNGTINSTTTVVEQPAIERRGAMISGLHSSDIAE